MRDIRKLEKCNGPVKVLITSCKSEQLWQAMSGRVNGKVQYCQLWELRLKRINSLFILRFLARLVRDALSFSKKLANHIGAMKLFLCHDSLTSAAASRALHGVHCPRVRHDISDHLHAESLLCLGEQGEGCR